MYSFTFRSRHLQKCDVSILIVLGLRDQSHLNIMSFETLITEHAFNFKHVLEFPHVLCLSI